ncbi:MAG: hypothetical protein KKG00_10280 [Bacteroidetes bacterium]|nr:hypothetical protein [Bacteroidota bacterium]
MDRLRIIVGGYIGLYPTGGATWDYIQYPLGLAALGHDVYYIEDTLQYPVFQQEGAAWNDATHCVGHLQSSMEQVGLAGRWAYRDIASGRSFGMSETQIQELCRTADMFINISCSTFMRDEYLQIPRRLLIDSDPMFTQIQLANEQIESEEAKYWSIQRMVESHTHHFTFGENIGNPGCRIPTFGYPWQATRQPICLDLWSAALVGSEGTFTTIMNWSERKKLLFEQEEWGQKDVEFRKFREVPAQVPNAAFEVVVNRQLNPESIFAVSQLASLGWRVLEPSQTVGSLNAYREYIHNSSAEFSVAKETYVKSYSGWFSGRSACYLAAGRPVVAQDTGWSQFLPTGAGLFSFSDVRSAVEACREVLARYNYHADMARQVAHEYFDSRRVLEAMLDHASVEV